MKKSKWICYDKQEMQKKGVETLIQQVQTTAANPVESEQIDLPEVVLQPLPMNAKVAEQHHFAHGLLEEMLFKRGIFKPYFMGEGKHGKPFLLEHPQIQFNISHCKNAVLCGIGSKPLGVDVETIRPMRERVLRRVLTASEQQEILQSESPELCFLRFWTLKESFVKALGVGISYLDWERLPADHPLARAHWSDKVLWMQTRTQGGQVHHCIGASASSTPGNMYLDLVTIAREL